MAVLNLRPVFQIERLGSLEGAPVFEASGGDPQLWWDPEAKLLRRVHAAGRLRIEVEAQPLEGALVDPSIYLDTGDGFTEAARIGLRQDAEGGWWAEIVSPGPALQTLRFDPSTGPCRFALRRFEVLPLAGSGAPRSLKVRLFAAVQSAFRLLPDPLRRSLDPLKQSVGFAFGRWAHRAESARVARKGWRSGQVPLSDRYRAAYEFALNTAKGQRSPLFAAPPLVPPPANPDAPRLIAFHLPQFHPIPENDAWWGKGFTEWTNVSKAVPQFVGHQQPKLPADLGWYDLRLKETLATQIDLARRGGIGGFCFHYYWFGGKRLLERPLDLLMDNPDLDFPFCLCWANENWTRRWDGQENEILIGQAHSPEDDVAVLDDLARYMRDPRYIRVEGRPLLVVYRPDILPDARATLGRWRDRAREIGLGELHVLSTNAFGFTNFVYFGFDGLVQFPPHGIVVGEITGSMDLLNADHRGKVYDYGETSRIAMAALESTEDPRIAPGVTPAWDNEARKPGAGHVFHDSTPETYLAWLTAAMDTAARTAPRGRRMVFVNAWNEWAEGAYLEPDRWYGHAYLQATRAAVAAWAPRLGDHPDVWREGMPVPVRRGSFAVLTHVFYRDLVEDLGRRVAAASADADVYVTFPDTWTSEDAARLRAAFPAAVLIPVENRGRDVAPFLRALRLARDAGHELFCKVHSKRSPHMSGGDAWRDRLFDALLAPAAVETASAEFAAHPRLGLFAPAGSRMTLGDPDVMTNNGVIIDNLARLVGVTVADATPFAAGTMFWGRAAAFTRLLDRPPEAYGFEREMGRIDGTVAHGLERLMAAVALEEGYEARFDL